MELLDIDHVETALDHRFLARSIGLMNPREPLLVQEDASLADVLQVLKGNKVGCVIVTNEDGMMTGIFSERDVVLKLNHHDLRLHETDISQLMTPKPQSAKLTTTLAFALNMMSQGGYRHIPIIDDEGCPIGIISVKDIVDYIVRNVVDDLSCYESE